jgi:hypothetical protein
LGTLAELSATGGVENQQWAREGFVSCLITGNFSMEKPRFETTIHANGTSRSLIKVQVIRALADDSIAEKLHLECGGKRSAMPLWILTLQPFNSRTTT